MKATEELQIIGGGLAGCEAAWQALSRGIKVTMYEMRPKKMTAAHQTADLCELVCSNSLKSLAPGSASGQLKEDMSAFDSLILKAAHHARVPAGQALSVDRKKMSAYVKECLLSHKNFTLKVDEVICLASEEQLKESNSAIIVATGPLTSDGLAAELKKISGSDERLYFYDAIAPIVMTDSIDFDYCFRQDRYDKGDGDGDYLNIPLDKKQYEDFISAVSQAEKAPLHAFEETSYFESCLPIEVMIERGADTLRFGPMKPVGLTDPKTGRRPYAVIQLRVENEHKTMYSMVGFQTKMKWPEQKRVFAMLPALKNADYCRLGSVHRNTYVESPKVLSEDLSFKNNRRVFLAGQITGVEGYLESAAIGLIAGHTATSAVRHAKFPLPPSESMLGALLSYVTKGPKGKFSPMNANLGLLPGIEKRKGVSKADRKQEQCRRAGEVFLQYLEKHPDLSLSFSN